VTEQQHGSHGPLGPSGSGSVVLELGPGTGALVLRTPPELDGREIEISACRIERVGQAAALPISACGRPGGRTHALVRPRHTAGGTSYAAVYPGLAAGDYVIWRDSVTPAMTVAVAGGKVSQVFFARLGATLGSSPGCLG
jgi:hypothetical protein